MGVDATGRAKYRKGELRLILGLPEPWSEAQRSDFLKAVEGLSRDVGVAPGDVHIQSALLATWNPSDGTPNGSLDSAAIEKLIVKFGVDEPRMRIEAFERGYEMGRRHGVEDAAGKALAFVESLHKSALEPTTTVANYDVDLPTARNIIDVQLPEFNLAPLSEAELSDETPSVSDFEHHIQTCLQCGEPLDVCNEQGCGGKVKPGFRWPLRETSPSEALADAAEPDLLAAERSPGRPLEETMKDLPCANDGCMVRHTLETPHVWGMDEADDLVEQGILCDDVSCLDFHYVNDGSPHDFKGSLDSGKAR